MFGLKENINWHEHEIFTLLFADQLMRIITEKYRVKSLVTYLTFFPMLNYLLTNETDSIGWFSFFFSFIHTIFFPPRILFILLAGVVLAQCILNSTFFLHRMKKIDHDSQVAIPLRHIVFLLYLLFLCIPLYF